jgi:hypothetical protein
MDALDAAVIQAIKNQVLTPQTFEAVVDGAIKLIEAQSKEIPAQVPKLEAELARIRRELANFLALVAAGTVSASIAAEIVKREESIKALEAELLCYQVPVRLSPQELARYRKMAIHQLGRFKEVLDTDVSKARQMLRKLLRDKEGRFVPIKLTPVEHNGRKTQECRYARDAFRPS